MTTAPDIARRGPRRATAHRRARGARGCHRRRPRRLAGCRGRVIAATVEGMRALGARDLSACSGRASAPSATSSAPTTSPTSAAVSAPRSGRSAAAGAPALDLRGGPRPAGRRRGGRGRASSALARRATPPLLVAPGPGRSGPPAMAVWPSRRAVTAVDTMRLARARSWSDLRRGSSTPWAAPAVDRTPRGRYQGLRARGRRAAARRGPQRHRRELRRRSCWPSGRLAATASGRLGCDGTSSDGCSEQGPRRWRRIVAPVAERRPGRRSVDRIAKRAPGPGAGAGERGDEPRKGGCFLGRSVPRSSPGLREPWASLVRGLMGVGPAGPPDDSAARFPPAGAPRPTIWACPNARSG